MSENRTKDMKPLFLHSDKGSPMKGATLLKTLVMLGGMPSNNRPRLSNANAYVKAIFKTLKYRPGYPSKGLACIEDARTWVLKFARGRSSSVLPMTWMPGFSSYEIVFVPVPHRLQTAFQATCRRLEYLPSFD